MKKHSISRWIILSFAGVFLFSMAIASIANYLENRKVVSDRANENAVHLLEIARIILDEEDNFKAMISSDDDEIYQQNREAMKFLANVFEVAVLEVYRIDPASLERKVILAVASDSQEDEDAGEERRFHTALSETPLQPVERQWLAGNEYTSGSFNKPGKTTWIMAGRNVDSHMGYLVAIELNIILQDRTVLIGFLWHVMIIGLTLLLGMIILLALVRRRIIMPIGAISNSMNQFAANGSHKPEPLRLKAKNEIGEIAASYTKMTEDISAYVNSIESLTKEKLETDVQLDVARRIQYGLVPGTTSLSGDGFDVSAMTQPARAVGGDFYDCFRRDSQSICVVMGDVSGKGISAAIFMAMAKTMIKEKLMAGLSPAKALNQANEELCGQNPEGLFATTFAAVLNPGTGELCYANAGHTRPVLLGEKPALLKPDPGIALGLFRDSNIQNCKLTLAPGEGIMLYTDGITEAVDIHDRFFGEQRLLDVLDSVPKGADAGKVLQTVSSAVSAFFAGREAFDDIAGLVLFHTPAGNGRQQIPVALSSFEEIKQTVFAAAGDTPETRKALLACDEVLANIVSYSGATDLFFSCEKEGNTMRITFSDNGIPFDPTRAPTESKEFELLGNGGLGISLVRQTASEMRYERRQDRNEFGLSFLLQDDPA